MMTMSSLDHFSILVCGKTGVGKSSLINSILGKDVCRVSDCNCSDDEDDFLNPVTSKVEEFSGVVNGVKVTIYDSPGLCDGRGQDQEYLDDMFAKCCSVDLVFYCHDFALTRWKDDDSKTMSLFTKKFSAAFWDKAILALTRANFYREEEKKRYDRRVAAHEKRFRSELKEILRGNTPDQPASTDEIVDNVPVVPTGSERHQWLPDGHFIANLWVTCIKRLYDQKQTEMFIQVTRYAERAIPYTAIEGKDGKLQTMEDMMKAYMHSKGIATEYPLCIDKKNTSHLQKNAVRFGRLIQNKIFDPLKIFVPLPAE